jgi:hypothetical protein
MAFISAISAFGGAILGYALNAYISAPETVMEIVPVVKQKLPDELSSALIPCDKGKLKKPEDLPEQTINSNSPILDALKERLKKIKIDTESIPDPEFEL